MHIEAIQFERWPMANGDPPDVPARVFSRWDIRPHQVARLPALKLLGARRVPDWKTVAVSPAALPPPLASGLDLERHVPLVDPNPRA